MLRYPMKRQDTPRGSTSVDHGKAALIGINSGLRRNDDDDHRAAPNLARDGCCCLRRCYGRVHSATGNGGRLDAAQAHRHRCTWGDPCNAGSGATDRRDDGDNTEPVARGDDCGQSRTGRVASPSSLAPALLALVFPPVLAMGLALAPSPASPPPGTAGDRDSSQQARRTGNRGAVATQSASS